MSIVTGRIARAGKRFAWSSIAVAISLTIIAIAAATLFRLYREIDPGGVVTALTSQSPRRLLLAVGCVAAGYTMLACYDAFALRVIGANAVPYRVAAFASFTSYTIGHNFGATIFTSGVIRYRIYSAWGLSIVDIAKIAFITSLTYWLGNALMLGGGVAYAPEAASALTQLPPTINRAMGVAGLLALIGYMLWLWPGPRAIGRANWRVVLPNVRWTLAQIALASLDLIFVTLAMDAVLPGQPSIDLTNLVVIFLAAMLLGVVSHAPGSIGVMEAAMFIGLPQFGKDQLLASLLTFRIVYFVCPLLIAALLLGVREFRLVVAGALGRGGRRWL